MYVLGFLGPRQSLPNDHFSCSGHCLTLKMFRHGVLTNHCDYRVTLVVEYLGWVDLDLGCSTTLLVQ